MNDHSFKYVRFKGRGPTYYMHKGYIIYRKYSDNVVYCIILRIISLKCIFTGNSQIFFSVSQMASCEDNEIMLPKDTGPSCFNFSSLSKVIGFKTSFPLLFDIFHALTLISLIQFPSQSRTFLDCACK